MVVYLDVLFCLNLLVDYFLLRSVSGLFGVRATPGRIILGATVGAVSSFAVFLPTLSTPLQWLIQLLSSSAIAFSAFGFHRLGRYIRLWLGLFGVSFAYGGVMAGVWFLLHPQGMLIRNGVVYFDLSLPLLIGATLLSYVLISLARRFFRTAPAGENLYRMTVFFRSKQVECSALLDTGHNLRDLFSDTPVVIMDYDTCRGLLPVESRPVFAGMCDVQSETVVSGFRLIPYSVVGGKGLLPAFPADYIEVTDGKETRRMDRVLIAVSKEKLSDQYGALFGQCL